MTNEASVTIRLVKSEREAELCTGERIIVPGLIANIRVKVPVLFLGFNDSIEIIILN